MKSISVVINARAASTRVPQKLIRPFAGRCLLDIALEKLNRLDFFEHRFLAAADEEIIARLDPKRHPNVELLERDQSAVKKGVNPVEVTFAHYLRVPSDYVFVMNPCLPMLTESTIRRAFDFFQCSEFNSYTAVVKTGDWIFDQDGLPLTNSDPRNVTTNKNVSFYKGCHAFHIHSKSFFARSGVLWTFGRNDPHLIEISGEEAVDVDTMDEFEVAEVVYKRERELRG
jgi:CMP-N-acetylneuraminic acid synthetase